MSWLQGFVSNWLAAEQLDELQKLNENMDSQRRVFDWDNKVLNDETEKAKAEFYSHYPHITRGPGVGKKYFPEKDEAIQTINKMANEGRLNELEYLSLFKEIFTYRESAVKIS